MTSKTITLTPELYDYILQVSYKETPVMRDLREYTASLPLGNMQISPEQAQFMAFLARLIQARKALEIGVFTGFSTLVVAQAMPADGRLLACDNNAEWTNIAQTYWQRAGVAQKIDLRLAPALETLNQLLAAGEQDSFDFTFIDADKENYPHYFDKALKLTRKGGIILLDNTLQDGRVTDPNTNSPSVKAIQHLNHQLTQNPQISLCLLPISDGLTLIQKL